MREIKFRAWNVEENVMCYDNEDDSACYWDGVVASNVGLINSHLKVVEGYRETYKYMQYTGLQDKNGVGIFEGDVLSRESYWKAFVGHEDGAFRWIPCDFVQRANFRPSSKNILTAESLTYWEVIGNIYENPELWKGVK